MTDSHKPSVVDAKNFLTQHRHAVLSTISASQKGFPFGSIVPYDIDPQGSVYIYISFIAEHYKNLKADPRASIIATDPFGIHDPQAYSRATLLLTFEPVSEAEKPAIQKRYEQRFPNSINYQIAHNFTFMKGSPVKLRWIAGFGDIRWFEGKDFIAASPDMLAYGAWEIISHMNEDHRDALRDLAVAHSTLAPAASEVCMTSVNCAGLSIRISGPKGPSDIHVPFCEAVKSVEQVRPIIIKTLNAARRR